MLKQNLLISLLLSLCLAIPALAAYPEIPRISIADLKTMIDNGEPVLILDTQPEVVHNMGHIAGAISFPWQWDADLYDITRLPEDKDLLLVTYCECGPGESDGANVANTLIERGFRNVKVLEDPSLTGWRALGYPVENEE